MQGSGFIKRNAVIDWRCLPRPRQREWARQVISPETRLPPQQAAETGFPRSRLETRTLVQAGFSFVLVDWLLGSGLGWGFGGVFLFCFVLFLYF